MTIDDFRYAELTQLEARGIDFSQVLTDSWDSARWNVDSSKCLVCWVGDTPLTIASLKGVSVKSQSNLKEELRTPGNKFREGKGAVPKKPKAPPKKK
tara:strand:- start:149 stop:439 length:291 start_codon:yes stop_codon:yes gene_type:complete